MSMEYCYKHDEHYDTDGDLCHNCVRDNEFRDFVKRLTGWTPNANMWPIWETYSERRKDSVILQLIACVKNKNKPWPKITYGEYDEETAY